LSKHFPNTVKCGDCHDMEFLANASFASIPKMLGECLEFVDSPKISEKAILANASTRPNWTFFATSCIPNICARIVITRKRVCQANLQIRYNIFEHFENKILVKKFLIFRLV